MIGRRVVWQAAAVCLGYPDADVVHRASEVDRALAVSAPEQRHQFRTLLDFWAGSEPGTVQAHYVDLFDLSRKHTLYLSYWTDGDTRRRGSTLAAIKQRFRRSGWVVDTQGELPDYLPLVLEYAALADPDDGAALLQEFRRSLELLRLSLTERNTPYAGVVTAVCGTLPGPSPADRQAVLRMAGDGPPTETVGLETGDPRLLPLGVR